MGHRANFIEIENGKATAYEDNWAALGSTYAFASGLEGACKALKEYKTTDELMDWAFAEAGYLIDHDQKTVIAFGVPPDLNEFGDDECNADMPDDPIMAMLCEEDFHGFLNEVAKVWIGWRLIWDDRGVDAFSEHLEQRGISSIKCADVSHPQDIGPPVIIEA